MAEYELLVNINSYFAVLLCLNWLILLIVYTLIIILRTYDFFLFNVHKSIKDPVAFL